MPTNISVSSGLTGSILTSWIWFVMLWMWTKKTHISSLIYFFLLDTDYVAFCFQCKYCILLSRWLHCNTFFFCISSEMAGCKRPHGLKGSLVLIKVSVNLTFDLPVAHFSRPGCCSSNLPPPGDAITGSLRTYYLS